MAAKYIIKNEAYENGCTATLMPKPLAGEVRVKLNENEKDAPRLYKCKDVKILKMPGKQDKSDEADDETEE